jgi:hypothetical protein
MALGVEILTSRYLIIAQIRFLNQVIRVLESIFGGLDSFLLGGKITKITMEVMQNAPRKPEIKRGCRVD